MVDIPVAFKSIDNAPVDRPVKSNLSPESICSVSVKLLKSSFARVTAFAVEPVTVIYAFVKFDVSAE